MANKEKERVKIPGRSALFTRKISNEGVRFPLCLANGDETEEWLLLRSRESDAYQKALLDEDRLKVTIEQIEDKAEKSKAILDSMRRLAATAVIAWSFPEPCTTESVRETLYEAPYLAEQIIDFIYERSNFCAGASSNLPGTPKPPIDSTESRPQDLPSP